MTRPLSDEMLHYARADTHFLLYIFDMLRNELLEKAGGSDTLVKDVLEESKKVSLQRYLRFNYDAEQGMGEKGWYYLLIKTPAIFSKQQFAVFRAVHQWRDQVARKEDESPNYLMPNPVLFNIARDMPSALPQLMAILNRKSDQVLRRVSELLDVIQIAKTNGLEGPEMKDFMRYHPANLEYQAKKAAKRDAKAQVIRQPSLAEVAHREGLNVSSADLQAEKSQFWGSTVNGHKRRKLDHSEPEVSSLCLNVPLPQFTAEVYAVDGDALVEAHQPIAPPEHPYIKPVKPDEEIFTLKEIGGSRKRKHNEETEPQSKQSQSAGFSDQDDTSPLNTSDQEQKLSRSQKRKLKKERKLAAKRKHSNADVDTEVDGGKQNADIEPFDYANAPSVLHAKHERPKDGKGEGVNPYAKSMDAPKGLPKKKKEIAGKSHTFKT
jgi:exosome complex exonuclease RRP6